MTKKNSSPSIPRILENPCPHCHEVKQLVVKGRFVSCKACGGSWPLKVIK